MGKAGEFQGFHCRCLKVKNITCLFSNIRRGLIKDSKKPKPFYGVYSESFDRFLTLLSPNRDEAANEYLSLRSKLLMYFQMRESSKPEDLADETLERLVRRVDETEEQIIDIRAYALGIAKNVLIEYQRSTDRTLSLDSQRLDLLVSPEQSQESIQQLDDCFQKCLNNLSDETKDLLFRYYSIEGKPMDIRDRLSRELGISLNALRVKIHRSRSALHHCIRSCLKLTDT